MLPLIDTESTETHPYAAPDARPARFDWYAATIMERPARLISVLASRLSGAVVPATPHHGYAEAVQIRAGDRVLATVYHGGIFPWPHAFASSDETDDFVEVVRSEWPKDHSVTRMDAALDFDAGDETFATLLALCVDLAAGKRVAGDERKRVSKVSVRNVGDWTFGTGGRTFYIGATSSAVQTRLYEKGIMVRQAAAAQGVPRDDVTDNWTRLEVQVRPDGPARRRAASCTPEEAFGYAEWSRELLRRVMGADVDRVHIRERRLSDHERAMRHVTMQYRKHFMHAAELAGGWEALGRALEARILDGIHGEMPAAGDDTPF